MELLSKKVIKKGYQKRQGGQVSGALQKADWLKHSNLAAHNCRHISMEHIRAALTSAGFVDAE